MQITTLAELTCRPRRVALGVFDGVHVGHHEVIRDCDTVLTFDPHPRAVIGGGDAPPLLTDRIEKLRRLAALGVDEVVVIRFDREVAAQPAETFVDEVLVARLGATEVSVGSNFNFGAGAKGNAATLAADSRFRTRVVPAVRIDGDVVSSSRIRELVVAGALTEAAALLGRPLVHPAHVRQLWVPSDPGIRVIRLDFDSSLALPRPGSYACLVAGLAVVVRVGARTARLVVGQSYDFFSASLQSGVVEVEFLAPFESGVALEPAVSEGPRR